MIPLLVPIGLGLLGGYLTKDSEHEMFENGGGVSQDKEVSEDRYYEMLGVVPPLYFSTLDGVSVRGGFAVGEVYTHEIYDGKYRGVYDAFYQKDGKYYQVTGMVYFTDKNSAKRAEFKYAGGGGVKSKKIKGDIGGEYFAIKDKNGKIIFKSKSLNQTSDFIVLNNLKDVSVVSTDRNGRELIKMAVKNKYENGGEVVGKRIEMIEMDDPQPIEKGTMGTIIGVDGIGQYMVKWDNGRNLSVIPDEDKFIIIEEEEEEDQEELCYNCNGTGEGMSSGSVCWVCGGYGVIKDKRDYEDYKKGGVVGEYRVYGYLRSYDTDTEVRISEEIVAMNEDDAIKKVLNMYVGASPDSDLMVELVDSYE